MLGRKKTFAIASGKFRKILITGGSGTIGIPTANELISRGIEVVVFDLNEQLERHESFLDPKVEKFSGSISAEHGIGQLKTNQLINTKDPNHYHIMTKIKNSLDPKNLLNPGRIIN